MTLLGRPGSGKTTVGRALEKKGSATLGAVHYVSGSRLLDEYIAAKRESWRTVKENKDSGRTADPRLTHQLLAERIETLEGSGAVLLDGFPKSVGEVARTDGVLPSGEVDLAILLDCPRLECVARIARRYVCGKCGCVSAEPMRGGSAVCDTVDCDGLLRRRSDDKVDVLEFREDRESPTLLAQHYEDLGRLAVIDADRGTEFVIGDTARVIDRFPVAPSSQNPH